MYHLFISILFILAICPAYSQNRANSPHFILSYTSIDSLSGEIDRDYYPEMKVTFVSPIGLYDTLDNLLVHLKGHRPILPFSFNIKGKIISYPSQVFLEISRRYKDTSYTKQRIYPWRYNMDVPVVNDTLLTIHVACDRYFDPTHPQGTYLDDLVVISYSRQPLDPTKNYQKNIIFNRVLLTDYNKNTDHTYFFPRGHWGLIKPPSKKGQYKFTFIVIDEKGRTHKLNYQPVLLDKEIGFTEDRY